jgi:hypothetical protein
LINVLLEDILWLMERFKKYQEELAERIKSRKIERIMSKDIAFLKRIDQKTKDEKYLSYGELNFLYHLNNQSEILNEENKVIRDIIAIRKSAISSLYKLEKNKQEDSIAFIVMAFIRNKGFDKVKNQSDLSEIHREVANLGLEPFFNEFLGVIGIGHNKDLSGGGTTEVIKEDFSERGNMYPVIVISEMDGTPKIFLPKENMDISVR